MWPKFKNVLLSIVSVFLIVLTLSLVTSVGTKSWLWLLNKSNLIQVTYKNGNLIHGLELAQVKLNSPNILLQNVAIKFDLGCLGHRELCIDKLSADNITIKQNATETQPNSTETSNHLITLPIDFVVNHIAIKQFELHSAQNHVTVQNFLAKVEGKNQSIHIVNLNIDTIAYVQDTQTATIAANIAAKPSSISKQSLPDFSTIIPEIALPLNIDVQQLSIQQITLSQAHKKYNIQKINLAALWQGNQLSVKQFAANVVNYAEFNLAGDITFKAPFAMSLAVKTNLVNFQPYAAINHSAQKIQLTGNIEQLALNVESSGSVELTSAIKVALSNQKLPFEFELDANKIPLTTMIDSDIAPSKINVHATGDLTAQQFTLESLITGYGYKNANIKLNAKHENQQLLLNSFSAIDTINNSSLNISGKLDYSEKLAWQLNVNSSGVNVPTFKFKTLQQPLNGRIQGTFNSTGYWQNNNWQLAINNTDLQGNVNQFPITITGNIALGNKGVVKPGELNITAKTSTLTISGFNDENWHINGTAKVTELEDWLLDARGDVTAAFTVSGSIDDPVLSLSAKGNDVFIEQLSAPAIDIKLKSHLLQNRQTKVSITAAQLSIADQNLKHANIALSGDISQQQVKASWQGDSTAKLQVSTDLFSHKEIIQAQIKSLAVNYQNFALSPNKAIALQYHKGLKQLSISEHCWQSDDFSLCFPEHKKLGVNGKLTATMHLSGKSLAPFLAPKHITLLTQLDGDIDLSWQQMANVKGNANFKLSSGKFSYLPVVEHAKPQAQSNENSSQEFSQPIEWLWYSGALNLIFDQQHVVSQLALNRDENTQLISIENKLSFSTSAQVDATVRVNKLDLAPVQSFIPSLTALAGELSTDIHVKGTLKQPIIMGDASIEQLSLTTLSSPTIFNNGQLKLNFTGNSASMLGNIFVEQQQAKLTGNANWQKELLADLDFNGDKLHVLIPGKIVLTSTQQLQAHIQGNKIDLTGDVVVHDGELTLNKLPDGGVPLSQDVRIVDDNDQVIVKQSNVEITTNVKVKIAKKFNVVGQGFTGHVGGDLAVSQQAMKPLQLFGNLQIIGGKYKAYGQDLAVEKGEISFTGPVTKPLINVLATRSIKDESKIVGIKLSGPADALSLQLFSDPMMEQNEILSYLIRGRGLDAGTSNSAATGLALGVGLTNATGWLSKLDKVPLLNNVELDTQGQGANTQATISGYLGNRVYLKYGIGVFSPVNELTLRFYLFNKLWVESVTSIEKSVDVYYSFDVN
jgi:translocation and assembly module TamB